MYNKIIEAKHEEK